MMVLSSHRIKILRNCAVFGFVRSLSTILFISCFTINTVSAQIQFENKTTSVGGPFHTGESWGASWGHMDEDVYPDLFVNNHGMLTSIIRNNGDGTFVERVQLADLERIWTSEPNSDIHGGSWADFDNDGDQDLFVTRSSSGARFHLFVNNGQGFFEERSGPLGIGGNGGGRMPILFDYTNDGLLDVALARNGGEGRIFKWDVNKFIQQNTETGLTGECNTSFSGFASDLFDTGSLDFLCTAESSIPFGAFSTATIPFADISSSIDSIGTNPDSVLADFNNDLKMDLFALRGLIRPSGVAKISDQRIESWLSVGGANNPEESITFSSNGPITVSLYARTVAVPGSVYIGASTYNPTSLPVTVDPADPNNWGTAPTHDINAYAIFIEYDEVVQEWTISLNTGGFGSEGVFVKVDGNGLTTPTIDGINAVDLPMVPDFLINDGSRLVDSGGKGIGAIMCGGIAAADFDNDMDIDLYLTCRSSLENLENRLYLNDGLGNFSLDTSANGAAGILGLGTDSGAGTAEMAITADYDVDGFMDLFVTNGNRLFPHIVNDGFTTGGPDQFHRNVGGNGNHWIEIDLEGVTTNRDGFGTKAIVTAGGVSQLREQNGKYHRWSHDHKRLHFGLGVNTAADVTIEWLDGTTDVFTAVAADKLYKAVQGASSMLDITPDPSAPSISIDSQSVDEGDSVTLTVSLSAPSSSIISVDYETIANTATENIDFNAASDTLTFAPFETTKQITLSTLINSELEPNEVFVVSLFNASGILINQSAGIVTIEEEGGLACGEPDYSSAQDKGLFVWRDCGNTDNWFVRTTAGGAGQTIYTGSFNANNQISSLLPFSFEGSDFAVLVNSDESIDFEMTMANTGEDGLEFALAYGAELCLMLDDPSHTIFVGAGKVPFNQLVNLANVTANCIPTLSIADLSISENIGSVDLTVVLSDISPNLVSMSYVTSDVTAIAGFDYVSVSGTLDILPNQTSGVITIPILQDSELESLESFAVTLSNPINALVSDNQSVISIEDDELTACGEPSFSPSTEAGLFIWQDCATEQWFVRTTAGGGGQIIYMGALSASTAISSVTPFSFEGPDFATLSAADKVLDFGMRMSNSGQDGIDFVLSTGSDLCLTLDDPSQVIYVGVDKNPFVSTVNLADVTGVCVAGLPTLSIDDITVSEAAASIDVTVTMSAVSANVVSLDYATSDGSAVDGVDYTAVSGNLDIQPNDTSAVISIPILQDSDVELLENFTVTLSNSVNADIVDASASVFIDDDELTACGQPSYSPSTEAGLFVWQDCATDQWFVRTTAGGGGQTIYMGALSASTAISSVTPFSFEGPDFATLSAADKVLDFGMRMSNSGQDGIDFVLSTGSDLCLTLDDPNQVIYVGVDKIPFLSTVNLVSVTGVCVAGIPALSIDDITVSEATASIDVTVTMSAVSASVVSLDYATSDGSAVDGFDYTAVSGNLDIQPNYTSAIISIPILQDSDVELLEDFTVTLSNSVNADIVDASASVFIDDDELTACGQPSYSPSTEAGLFVWQDCATDQWFVRTTAGGGGQTIYMGALSASNPMSSVTPFSFEGSDYANLTELDKVLGFRMTMSNSGQDGIDFVLATGSDLCLTLDDPNQVIYVGVDKIPFLSTVNLANVTGVCAAGLPTLSVADISVSESIASAEIVVTMSQVSNNIVSVSYTSSDGSAVDGLDYTAVSGTAIFQPNQTTASISVPILQDAIVESLEDFSVTLSTPVDADILDGLAVVSIEDDELSACGEPTYTPSTDAGLFVWQDCDGNDQWYIRATAGGGSAIIYTGMLTSDSSITALTTYSFEGIDSYSFSNSNQDLNFLMKMAGSGEDGMQFTLQPGSTCLDVTLPANIDVVVGENNELIAPPFDLVSLGGC